MILKVYDLMVIFFILCERYLLFWHWAVFCWIFLCSVLVFVNMDFYLFIFLGKSIFIIHKCVWLLNLTSVIWYSFTIWKFMVMINRWGKIMVLSYLCGGLWSTFLCLVEVFKFKIVIHKSQGRYMCLYICI